ncbi:MAG: hypothetical protein AAFY99_09495 [Pseudomonadota bacterium]
MNQLLPGSLLMLYLTTVPASASAWAARFGEICELIYADSDTSVRLTYHPTNC